MTGDVRAVHCVLSLRCSGSMESPLYLQREEKSGREMVYLSLRDACSKCVTEVKIILRKSYDHSLCVYEVGECLFSPSFSLPFLFLCCSLTHSLANKSSKSRVFTCSSLSSKRKDKSKTSRRRERRRKREERKVDKETRDTKR